MVTALKASDGTVLRKYGYAIPSLSVGLVDAGERIGTREPDATCVAISDAPEHPAPMITVTPSPSNASRVRCSASASARSESHLLSRNVMRRFVFGSNSSATESLLLLISRSAWYTPTRGDQHSRPYSVASVPNMGSSTPIFTVVTCGGTVCDGRLLSAVENVGSTPASCRHRFDQLHDGPEHGLQNPTLMSLSASLTKFCSEYEIPTRRSPFQTRSGSSEAS
eukprot:2688029-Prymnesium_polylepis.1